MRQRIELFRPDRPVTWLEWAAYALLAAVVGAHLGVFAWGLWVWWRT